MNTKTVGIVGGGQLGKMLTDAALPLGFDVVVVDPGEHCPATQAGATQIVGNITDESAIRQLGEQSDFLTIEIEHIDVSVLEDIERAGTTVNPSPATIRMIQDKYLQKKFLDESGIPVGAYVEIINESSAKRALDAFGGTMMLKARHGAYDGRGNKLVASASGIGSALDYFNGAQLYAEKIVKFKKELAVMIARDFDGNTTAYPIVETVHQRSICIEVHAPAPIDDSISRRARDVALQVAEHLRGAGVFGIEMFLTEENDILVNEIAPRVHNSGHYTMDACETSQFEQHIRAITDMELGSVEMITPASSMINILGERDGPVDIQGLDEVTSMPQTFVHLYGKSPTKIDRKMGHINVIGETLEQTTATATNARSRFSI